MNHRNIKLSIECGKDVYEDVFKQVDCVLKMKLHDVPLTLKMSFIVFDMHEDLIIGIQTFKTNGLLSYIEDPMK